MIINLESYVANAEHRSVADSIMRSANVSPFEVAEMWVDGHMACIRRIKIKRFEQTKLGPPIVVYQTVKGELQYYLTVWTKYGWLDTEDTGQLATPMGSTCPEGYAPLVAPNEAEGSELRIVALEGTASLRRMREGRT